MSSTNPPEDRDPLRSADRPWQLPALAAAVAVLSWWSGELENNDFERLRNTGLFVAFLAAFASQALVYANLVDQAPKRRGLVLPAFAALAACSLLTFPIGAKDVFLYAFYGKMWAEHGANPYLYAPAAYPDDSWFRFIQAWWNEYPAAYGPLFLVQTRLLHVANDLWPVVASHKLFNVPVLLAAGWAIRGVHGELGRARGSGRAGALWLLSPLVAFEALGNAHNDATMALFLVVAVLAWQRDQALLWGGALALAFWYKWYAFVLLPVWVAWSFRRWGRTGAAKRFARATPVAAAVTALALFPFYGALGAMVDRASSFQNVWSIFPTELPPPLWILFQIEWQLGLFSLEMGRILFDAVRLGGLVLGLCWLVWRRRGVGYAAALFVEDCIWSLALFFGLAVTILWPWHLLPICALISSLGEPRWNRALAAVTAVGLLSYFLTFALATIGIGVLLAALWVLRHRG